MEDKAQLVPQVPLQPAFEDEEGTVLEQPYSPL